MSREDYLATLPVAEHFDPCRCRKVTGYVQREDMPVEFFVCSDCRKPAGGNWLNSPFCYGCNERYTLTPSHLDTTLCQSCNPS